MRPIACAGRVVCLCTQSPRGLALPAPGRARAPNRRAGWYGAPPRTRASNAGEAGIALRAITQPAQRSGTPPSPRGD
ncbi:hypothetical protein GCM10010347_10770 [Streptomyces cirratus]|uniref:Uncharacterized protein n=1 Tax=Streptomyces cirratus TaxID=68187 RepID=A0ABQ3EK08_9ACTN|nr:hypothetical protein GCM10010347_10770 [Streptomyces cirratus]